MERLDAYCKGLIERKRAEPSDDLLSRLIAAGEMSNDELTGTALQFFAGGQDTVIGMCTVGTYVLLSDRSRWGTLVEDPYMIANAVEELLRYITIAPFPFTRTALEDVDVGGTVIRGGESVTVTLDSANRDPARFPDADRLDLRRDATGQLALGHGRHKCLGQHLGRAMLEIEFTALVTRMPTLHMAVPAEEVRFTTNAVGIRGIEALQVAW